MADTITKTYRELAAADKDVAKAELEYEALQDELTKLEFIRRADLTAADNLQKDIHTLNRRLETSERDVQDQCSRLEEKYGSLVPGKPLPDTFEELLSLSGEEKIYAEKHLQRIVKEHGGDQYYTLEVYDELKKVVSESERKLFQTQLDYGQLPENAEEIYALDEHDPNDKQMLDKIMQILNEKNPNLASESRSTFDQTKKAYEKIEDDVAAIRQSQLEREEQLENLKSADLKTLGKQYGIPNSGNEETKIITEDTKTLINGELKKNAKSLGISSLDEYFKREKDLLDTEPDTRAIDILPSANHFFTEFSEKYLNERNEISALTKELIEKYQKTNPTIEGAPKSIEAYQSTIDERVAWDERRYKLVTSRTSNGLVPAEILREFPEGEVKNKAFAYNQAQREAKELEKTLAIKSFAEYPIKMDDIAKLKENKPFEYEAFSDKIRALAENAVNQNGTHLFGSSYNADELLKDYVEMQKLEQINKDKTQFLNKNGLQKLVERRDRIREMERRLEEEKKKNTDSLGRRIFSDAEKAEKEQIADALKQKQTEVKNFENEMIGLAEEECQKYVDLEAFQKAYIKRTIVEPEQKIASEKKKAYENKKDEHKTLTDKVNKILADLKKTKEKELENSKKALGKQEISDKEQNRNSYVNASSTKDMIKIMKEVNKNRKSDSRVQDKLHGDTYAYATSIKTTTDKVDNIKKDVEKWIKEDKAASKRNIETVNKEVKKELTDDSDTLKSEARKARRKATVMGFTSQKVGSFTDFYRKKIKEISESMIKAPRLEKEAELEELKKEFAASTKMSGAMERNNAINVVEKSAMEQAQANQKLNHANEKNVNIAQKIQVKQQEIEAMKLEEKKRLQENNEKFNRIFGGVILTDPEQMKLANEAKRDAEIAAAKGDQKKIERAKAEFQLRQDELNANLDMQELENQEAQKEMREIDEKSEEWGKIFSDANKTKIDQFISVGEAIVNFVGKKVKGAAPEPEGWQEISVREKLNEIEQKLSEPKVKEEHVVDQILRIGELVYQKLQLVNENLNTIYQEASDEHALKHEFYNALEQDNKRFMDICEKDVENKMGVSLKDKRITYLNEMKDQVKQHLNREIQSKREAKADVQKKVENLDGAISSKQEDILNADQDITNKISKIENLEKTLNELRDDRLEQYRREKAASGMTDKAISESAEGIRIHTDPSQPVSGADLIGQLTGMRPDDNTKLEDVMEQIQKINVNGIGLINFVDPSNRYSNILSAGEAEQKAFKDELLNTVGTVLKSQLGNQIVSVEQDDMMLHPVLMEGNEKFNKSAKSMVAGLNAVRLDSAKLNVMKKTSASALTEHDKQIQPTLDKAVKQSRSRVSLSSLMEKEKQEKGSPRRERQESGRTRERSKDADQTSRGKGIGL